MKLCKLLLIYLMLMPLGIMAQDNHFSQFYNNPVEVNPSLIALRSNWQVDLMYRNQWSGIIKPYRTSQLNAKYPLLNTSNERWGAAGISFLNDRSGQNNFLHTNRVSGLFAYNLPIDSGKHYLSPAMSASYIVKRINTSSLTSGNQWVNGTHNPNVALGENFENNQVGLPSITSSLLWYMQDEDGSLKGYGGVSFFNMNQPGEDFLGTAGRLPLRWSLTGAWKVYDTRDLEVFPKALYMRQSGARNLTFGSNVKYHLDNYATSDYLEEITLGAGIYHRLNDAMIFSVSAHQKHYEFGFSYDVNTSSLHKNTGHTAAMEFFMAYRMPVKREKPAPKQEIKPEPLPEPKPAPDTVQKDTTPATPPKTNLNINILDSANQEPLHAGIILEDDSSNITEYQTNGSLDTNLTPDRHYKIKAVHPDYFAHQQQIDVERGQDSLNLSFTLRKIPKETKPEILRDITFKTGTSELDSSSKPALDNLVDKLKRHKDYHIKITGYTDSTASHEFNMKLSKERARAVAQYLKQNGIAAERIETGGAGETNPIAPNSTEAGRKKNRRVEFKLFKPEGEE